MSLITCPNCTKPVSDKADVCPNCNCAIRTANLEATVLCEDCGSAYIGTLSACPVCGCPTAATQPISRSKNRKIIISVCVFFLILIISFGIVNAKKSVLTEYSANMTNATQKMYDGAVKAEQVGNLIKSVWNNAIYEKRDEYTDKYTMPNGNFVDDFNDALSNLLSDEELNKNISEIRKNRIEVTELMKSLKNPPQKYQEAYNVLKNYYDNYVKFTNLSINPTGSLNSFSEDFNTLDTELLNAYQEMQLYLE